MHTGIYKRSHVHMTEDGDQPVLFTLRVDLLKDTDLYQDGPALCPMSSLANIPLSYGAPVDVPQRAIGLEKEMQRMLNTKPMAADTPHPSLSAPSNLFYSPLSQLNSQPLQGVPHIRWNYAKGPSNRADV